MYVKVKVTPGAKKELFKEEKKDMFRVSVKEPAKKNLANKKIIMLIARHFKVPLESVRIVNGHRHSSKLISIEE